MADDSETDRPRVWLVQGEHRKVACLLHTIDGTTLEVSFPLTEKKGCDLSEKAFNVRLLGLDQPSDDGKR